MSVPALAQAPPSLETIGPGFVGFLAIFALAVATVLLLRSMVGHLRKVRYSPDPAAQDQQDPPETGPASQGTTADTPGDAPGREV